jgi:hypothetical protein
MATEKTRTELVREAAERLNIVGTGQPLEAEYSARIDGNVDPLIMQLQTDGICNVANDQFIPAEWFDSLAGLLANMSAFVAGKGFDPGVKEYYESRLRRLTSQGPSFAVLESEYF